jgi:hypothetical protein
VSSAGRGGKSAAVAPADVRTAERVWSDLHPMLARRALGDDPGVIATKSRAYGAVPLGPLTDGAHTSRTRPAMRMPT